MSKYTIANVGSYITSDDEFYTPQEPILELIKMLKLSKEKVIWCPFDTEQSNFVKCFKEAGYNVLNSHIQQGQDFYNYEPKEQWDIIISNPPFKGKKNIINRCKEFNKPYILLLGSAIAFQNGMADILNKHKLYFIYKPITFKNINKDKKFLCLWLMKKELKYDNFFNV